MAFTRNNLICVVKSGGLGTGLWFYDAGADDVSDVQTDGYFDTADDVMLTGDVLIASMSDQSKIYKVTRTAGDVALNAGIILST